MVTYASFICEVRCCSKENIIANMLDTRTLKNKGQHWGFKHQTSKIRKKLEWIKIKLFFKTNLKVEKMGLPQKWRKCTSALYRTTMSSVLMARLPTTTLSEARLSPSPISLSLCNRGFLRLLTSTNKRAAGIAHPQCEWRFVVIWICRRYGSFLARWWGEFVAGWTSCRGLLLGCWCQDQLE